LRMDLEVRESELLLWPARSCRPGSVRADLQATKAGECSAAPYARRRCDVRVRSGFPAGGEVRDGPRGRSDRLSLYFRAGPRLRRTPLVLARVCTYPLRLSWRRHGRDASPLGARSKEQEAKARDYIRSDIGYLTRVFVFILATCSFLNAPPSCRSGRCRRR